LLEGKIIHVADVLTDQDYSFLEAQKLGDFRTILGVPMLREGTPIGVLALTCVYQKSDSAILVMKTTENRSRCDDSEALNRARERGIFAQRAMNS